MNIIGWTVGILMVVLACSLVLSRQPRQIDLHAAQQRLLLYRSIINALRPLVHRMNELRAMWKQRSSSRR